MRAQSQESVSTSTQASRRYLIAIRVIMVFQFIIAIANFVAGDRFAREGVFAIIFIIILYGIQNYLSYQAIMFYIFISIFFAIRFLLFFIEPFQKDRKYEDFDSGLKIAFWIAVISFIYYTFCLIFFYHPYKVFKKLAFNENPALRKYFNMNVQESGNRKLDENFQQGTDYQVNYFGKEIELKLAPKRQDENYEIQRGKGIVIG